MAVTILFDLFIETKNRARFYYITQNNLCNIWINAQSIT